MKFTIGTDPEFMLRKDGEYASSIGVIKGSKHIPQRFGCGTTLQRDNVAVEFATPVCSSEATFLEAIRRALFITKKELPTGFDLVPVPSAHFKLSLLDNKEAQEIGCEPDYNAWTGQKNIAPVEEFRAGTLRSCGAHIHVGHPTLRTREQKLTMIQTMDYIVGNTTVPLDCDAPAIERRKLYGKAGCFRPTNYGVEYRTLSNFWLKSPDTAKLIYNLTHDSLIVYDMNKTAELMELVPMDEMWSAVNFGDEKQAMKNLKLIKKYISKKSMQLFGKCMKNLPNYTNLEEEWKI